MPDTAPVPNIVPIPGVDMGPAVAAGSGGSGGDDNDANKGDEKDKAAGEGGDGDADGDGRNAQSDPIDAVTGEVYTLPTTDLFLPGPLPLVIDRSYNSKALREDQGLGYGWAHSLGWFIEVRHRRVRVWNHKGAWVSFTMPEIGHSAVGHKGWLLRRDAAGFTVDAGDDVWRSFAVTFDNGETFRLTAVTDRNNNRIAITYEDGKLVEVVDSAGRIVKVATTQEGRIASLQVKNAEHQGRWIAFARYEYDERGRLVRVTDADDHSWTYEYDEYNRLVRHTNRVGLSFFFRYDKKDRGIEGWGEYRGKKDPSLADDAPIFLADGKTRAKGIYHCKLHYHENGYTEVTDSVETRRYFGNRKGTVDKAVAGGSVTSSKWNERGFEIERTDAVGATCKWIRDERGRILRVIDPLDRRTTFVRDETGLTTQVIDPGGGVAQSWRDRHGNVEAFKDPSGGISRFTYDERGLKTSIANPTGAEARFTYDSHGNLTEMLLPNGGTWSYQYDGLGRPLASKDPTGAETRYVYTDRGDLVAVHDAAGGVTRYAYDGEGHVVQVTNPSGRMVHFGWGGNHKLCARRNANNDVVRLAYSRDGELVAVFNEHDEIYRLHYDTAGRLVGEDAFDGRTLRYRNDAAGRIVRVESGSGEITKLEYDLLGNLVARELPDGAAETFEYDACGRIVAATNSAGQFRFVRDPSGRVLRETQTSGGEEHWVESTYNARGDRVGRRTSASLSERIERDSMGARAATWLDDRHRIEHTNDLLTRELKRRLPGGGIIQSAFDSLGRLLERTVRTPKAARQVGEGEPEWMGRRDDGTTAATSYVYDADGELASTHDRSRGLTRYEYDPIGQLLAAVPEKARAEVFRYDSTGNIYEATGEERVYGKGNRLLRKGSTDYEWDDDGRLSTKREVTPSGTRVWRYSWNGAGLLQQVETPEGRRVQFSYDPFARRVEKRISEAEGLGWSVRSRTRFLWDGEVLAHEIRRGSEAAGDRVVEEKTYLFEDRSFSPLAHRDGTGDGAEWFHYANDTAGSPTRLTDGAGEIACELERSGWMLGVSGGGRTTTPIRYEGQYEDADVGLTYNRFRYYDSSSARFTSHDPLRLDGPLNEYAYVKNPFAWTDPYGCDWNYRLTDSNGTPYYYGRASDNQSPADVMARHTGSGRMDQSDNLEQITPQGSTRNTVRGVEQAGIMTGGPGGTTTLNKNCPKSNQINGVNPNRTDQNAKNYRAAGSRYVNANSPSGNAEDLPALSTHSPMNPRATSGTVV